MHFTMFQGHTFLRDLLSERSVVLDLGANQGAFAREIHQETGCRVIAVEANAALARSIKREPWLIVHHVLVCGDQGTRVLNLCNNTQASSTVRLEGFQYEGSIEVNATSLSALLRSPDCQGVNIVKCDIEGAEIEAFASCPDDLLVRLSQISIEFHHTMGGGTRDEAASLIRRLQRLGFWWVNFNHRTDLDVLFVRRDQVGAWTRLLLTLRILAEPSLSRLRRVLGLHPRPVPVPRSR